MKKKTEELRDIFLSVADDETVTDRQEESPGSLADDARREERLSRVISNMRDRYEFETDLSTESLAALVEGFYEGRSDEELAAAIDADAGIDVEGGDDGADVDPKNGTDVDSETIFRARMDLHLVRERERDAPFDLSAFRKRLVEEPDVEALATAFDVDPGTAERYRQIVESENEARRSNYRYRDEFAELVADGDLAATLTREVREDGLADATDGLESNVSF